MGSSRRKASVYLALLFAARALGVATTIVGVTLTQFGGRYKRTLALTIEEG